MSDDTAVNHSSAQEIPPHCVGEPLPVSMGPKDLRRVLGMAESTFRHHNAAGRFDRFKLRNPIGIRKFSGRLVQAYLDGGAKR